MARDWTNEQRQAITTRGKGLLVSAAAGSGKTSVLAERCSELVCAGEGRCNVNQLLVVTYTDAAAAEMRARIEQSIRARATGAASDEHLRRQLKLIDHATISTIHSFCMRLLRHHFHRVDLDPDFEVLDEDEALLMRDEVVRQLFLDRHEAGDAEFERFLDAYGGGRDETLMGLVVATYHQLCSVIDPQAWIDSAVRRIEEAADQPLARSALGRYFLHWTNQRLRSIVDEAEAAIQAMPDGFGQYVDYVQKLAGHAADWMGLLEAGGYDALAEAVTTFQCPRRPSARSDTPGKDLAASLVERVQETIKDKALLGNLRFTEAQWRQTMRDTAAHASVFLGLVDEFGARYARAKREARGLDFSDLERLALRLLAEDPAARVPSDVARSCHRTYRHVLVDEYQDINQVQEAILRLVSRECLPGARSNLFCVGDVKQSIYRFRLAEPALFLEREARYRKAGQGDPVRVIDLSANFRSRAPLLNAVNAVFERLMYKAAAEIDYGERHRLSPGADYAEGDGVTTFRGAPLELHVLPPPDKPGEEGAAAPAEHTDLDRTDIEALLIVRRIREMMGLAGGPRMNVMERAGDGLVPRPIEYGDCVILLRTLKYKAEQFAAVLRRYGIPVHCSGGAGFFESVEVRDMLALLRVLDNQRQDLPLAALLRSPLAMLPEPDDALARIRLAFTDVPFHQAVMRYAEEKDDELAAHLRDLLAQLARWRDAATKRPVAEVIWRIYDETGYLAYTAGLEDGEQRQANLLHLHERARQFGAFRRQGLYRFIQFLISLEAQTDPDLPSTASQAENAVRIMSIHRSKGLEFPVVFVPDLGKQINLQDGSGSILVDREAQLGLKVIDTVRKVTYPSLAHVVVRDRIIRAAMAEELRVLYVAMTRAREHLVLIGTADAERPAAWRQRWAGHAGPLPVSSIVDVRTMLDWLGPVAAATEDRHAIELRAHTAADVAELKALPREARPTDDRRRDLAALKPLDPPPPPDDLASAVIDRVTFRYPHHEHCDRRAVVAATAYADLPGHDGEATSPVAPSSTEPAQSDGRLRLPRCVAGAPIEGRDRGTATHLVLQHLDFSDVADAAAIRAQVQHMAERRFISPEQAELVDVASIEWFLSTDVGRLLRRRSAELIREQPFYMAVDHPGCAAAADPLDRLMVRGRIDLMLLEPDGCTLVDYKTDRVDAATIADREAHYRQQMALYRRAVNRATGLAVKAVYLAFLSARQIVAV